MAFTFISYNINMLDENRLFKIIDELETHKKLFFAGILQDDEKFIHIIQTLDKQLPEIKLEKLKNKVQNFVSSVKKHKNYNLCIAAIQKRKEMQELFDKIAKEKLQKKKELEAQKAEKEAKERELLVQAQLKCKKVIHTIKFYFQEEKYKEGIELFENYKYDIRNFDIEFYQKVLNKLYINSIIDNRKIWNLIHFTDIRNLESILTKGIIPRETLEKEKFVYYPSDEDRFDNKSDCTSLSVEFPNYKMLYYKSNTTSNKTYAIIVLRARPILLGHLKRYYIYINAASSSASWWIENEKLCSPEYFENMFKSEIPSGDVIYERNGLPSYLTTNPQAEILLNGVIPVDYIEEICVKTEQDYNKLCEIFTDKNLINKIPIKISDKYFKNRDDIEWEIR